jgi:AraC family transcriptional activator of pyochelin receptor
MPIQATALKNSSYILLTKSDIEKIHASKEYLLLNMDNPPTLKELAHRMGMNDFKLKKGYKQVFGTTIFGDFNRSRMEKALFHLLHTELSLADISLLVGYQDSPNFIRAFRSWYGTTPGQVRKQPIMP